MKKIIVTIGMLVLATLVACGGSVDTDALVDQAADAAKDGLNAAQGAIEEGVDSAQEALDDALAEDAATATPVPPTATPVPPTATPTEVPEVHTASVTNMPSAGSEFEPGAEINVSFDYTTTSADGGYIVIQPLTGGTTSNDVEYIEQYIESGSGSGSGVMYTYGDSTIDQLQVQVYDALYQTVLFEEKIDVNFVIASPVVEEEVHPVFNELADNVALRGSNVANDYDSGAGVTVNVGAAFEYDQSTWNRDFPEFNLTVGQQSWIVWIDPTNSQANTNVLIPKFSETTLGKEANDKLVKQKFWKVTAVGAINNPILAEDTMEVALSDPNSSDGPYTVTFFRGESREVVTSFTIDK